MFCISARIGFHTAAQQCYLGEYFPVATAFKDALLDHGDRVSTAFLELLALVEERHLEKSPGHYMPHGHIARRGTTRRVGQRTRGAIEEVRASRSLVMRKGT